MGRWEKEKRRKWEDKGSIKFGFQISVPIASGIRFPASDFGQGQGPGRKMY
jgi:hypothetical protein